MSITPGRLLSADGYWRCPSCKEGELVKLAGEVQADGSINLGFPPRCRRHGLMVLESVRGASACVGSVTFHEAPPRT